MTKELTFKSDSIGELTRELKESLSLVLDQNPSKIKLVGAKFIFEDKNGDWYETVMENKE